MRVLQGLSKKGVSVIAFWLTAIVAVLVDQATKVAVRHLMPLGSPPRVLIPGVLNL